MGATTTITNTHFAAFCDTFHVTYPFLVKPNAEGELSAKCAGLVSISRCAFVLA